VLLVVLPVVSLLALPAERVEVLREPEVFLRKPYGLPPFTKIKLTLSTIGTYRRTFGIIPTKTTLVNIFFISFSRLFLPDDHPDKALIHGENWVSQV